MKTLKIKRSTQTPVHVISPKKKSFFQEIRSNYLAYLLALPAAIYTFIFGYATFPYMLIAFQKFDYRLGIFGSEWVWFDNFKFFFSLRSSMASHI